MTGPVTDPLSAAAAARRVLEALAEGKGVVSALVLDGEARGRRRVVAESGADGALGQSALEEAIDALAREVLSGARSCGPRGRAAGTHTLADETRIYLEHAVPAPELLIVGAGHLAGPLARVGALLGFRVTVLDDRPEFARAERFPEAERVLEVSFSDPFADVSLHAGSHLLLVTRGHRYDFECLRVLLAHPIPPVYIGMIGSRRRVRATFHQLREEGFDDRALARVHAPVGLDLGAETPEEIAVAVAAELVLVRRGGTGAPLSGQERVAERFFREEDDDDGEEE